MNVYHTCTIMYQRMSYVYHVKHLSCRACLNATYSKPCLRQEGVCIKTTSKGTHTAYTKNANSSGLQRFVTPLKNVFKKIENRKKSWTSQQAMPPLRDQGSHPNSSEDTSPRKTWTIKGEKRTVCFPCAPKFLLWSVVLAYCSCLTPILGEWCLLLGKQK